MSISILLVDDHALFREGLRSLLEKQADFIIMGEAGDGREAMRLAEELKPNVVLMDIGMPELNGIEATHQITRKVQNTKIIALSMHCDNNFVGQILKAGAAGYLLKDSVFEDLVSAIRTVVTGKAFLSPQIASVVIEDYTKKLVSDEKLPLASLSSREKEVIQLIAEGKTSKEIASTLSISTKTAENHRKNIMEKLDIHSVAELTKYAVRQGITSL